MRGVIILGLWIVFAGIGVVTTLLNVWHQIAG
jgi:hypothetical protein